MQPLQIADLLVPRLLSGESMTTQEIQHEFGVEHRAAQEAVRRARDVLLDDYNVVLPVAHYQDGWLLAITTNAVDAFLGEVPQLRALRTRERNLVRRLTGALALMRTRRRMGSYVLGQLKHSLDGLELAINGVETYMAEEIEEVGR
jgi:hypothetical protein